MKNNQYALITGATSGIGHELAKLFAADGWNLLIVARSAEDLIDTREELISNYDIDVVSISKDLFDPGNATSLYKEIQQKQIEIEVLVNDAGQGVYGEFVNNELEKELNIIHLNIDSLVILTKHFFKRDGSARSWPDPQSFFHRLQITRAFTSCIPWHQSICAIFHRSHP